jgi:phospholipase/lecithinase/hemolysin
VAIASTFTGLYVFGNSLSSTDAGYSDGPLWPEYLAPQLGFAYDSTGNYAMPGASLSSSGILEQVDTYKMSTTMADPTALYVVWSGVSDTVGPVDAVNSIVSAVDSLSSFGAMNFLIPNTPDLGLAPLGTEAGTEVAIYFNTLLDSAFSGMDEVTIVDLFELHHEIYADPAAYGFTNVTDPCKDDELADCDTYMFWDSRHPTTLGHSIFADEFASSLSAVPVPAAVWLFASGLIGLIGMARRKRC